MIDPVPSASLDEAQAVQALAALSQAARLRVYRALVVAGEAGMTPGVLAALLDAPASTLSFHLKTLQVAGLVDVERASRHLIYRASVPRMNALLAYLTDHCCGGRPCGLGSAAAMALVVDGRDCETSPCC
jgi:DNA-binding transcriptional ArsR family regulator